MRFAFNSAGASSIACCLTVLAAGYVAAQTPTRGPGPAVVTGTVTDSSGAPIKGAFVQVSQSMGESQGEIRTGDDGRFLIDSLEGGGPYVVAVRKVGFRPVAFYNVELKAGDTSKMVVKLTQLVTGLNRVVVQAPQKGSPLASTSITAEEIDEHPVRSVLDVIDRYRPTWLKGGLGGCRPPNKVYINGIRSDRPGEGIEYFLYDLHPDDVQEMRYADCHSKLPIDRQDAIYIVTRPGLDAIRGK